ncbi:e2f-associated phosphoprotein [Phtheirospermum japonicum]|uniref:E2f-associated phosphoprotein n=1 Tax=Phtheirospermum japonicum TaxID=374723 RepID=A0A830B7H1_9LAMI|nr:e2f-associated phosphoprotein [Phtheirospermum japonicum]
MILETQARPVDRKLVYFEAGPSRVACLMGRGHISPGLGPLKHEKYVTRYRAIFVVNCRIKEEVAQPGSKRTRNKGSARGAEAGPAAETFKRVCCSVCSTDVGVIDEDEVYHFFNVLPSEA